MKPIRLTFQEITDLYDAHAGKRIPFVGPHYDLLREHAADFVIFFAARVRRGNQYYNIKFTGLQALAFTQLWVEQPLPPYAALLINQVIAWIDCHNKNAKTQRREAIYS